MESIAEIKKVFADADISEYSGLIEKYGDDERDGVKKIIASAQKKINALEKEKARSYKMFEFERKYADKGYICGIDEVGRGPLAGPVVAAAVILPKDCDILYLNDSKQLTPKKREALYDEIMAKAVAVGVGMANEKVIDEINVLNADYEAMKQAISKLQVKPQLLLNDAVNIPGVDIEQVGIIKGDTLSASIAAASIIAKVTRDRLMVEYDSLYPGYGFAKTWDMVRQSTLMRSRRSVRAQYTEGRLSRTLYNNCSSHIYSWKGEMMYNSRATGNEKEALAADHLAGRGYEILCRNFRVASGEIDIVAKHDGYIVFIEVKYRSGVHKGLPEEAVDVRKQRQICRTALFFLNKYGYGMDTPVRFDVITILGEDIHHIENAFEYSGY